MITGGGLELQKENKTKQNKNSGRVKIEVHLIGRFYPH